jgi:Flp pilus assembly protein TadG
MSTVLWSPCRSRLMNKKGSLIADQRGAIAFEMIIVYFFMCFSLLLPLADVAIAGLQYISAWQALRAFGQYVQYNNPTDPTSPATWSSGLQKTISGYTIGNIQVMCGSNAVCSSGNLTTTLPNGSVVAAPKYLTFSTTITLAPMVLRSVLCPSSCTYTLPYSERFQ